MARSILLFSLSGIMTIFSIALLIAALTTNRWWTSDSTVGSQRYGLFERCVSGAGVDVCDSPINYGSAVANTNCNRSPQELEERFTAMQWMSIAAGIAMFISLVFQVLDGCCNAVGLRFFSVLFLVLTNFPLASTMALFDLTLEHWLYCGNNFCSYFGPATPGCSTTYGYSFIIYGVTLGVVFVGSVFIIAATCVSHPDEEKPPVPPPAPPPHVPPPPPGHEEIQVRPLTAERTHEPTPHHDSANHRIQGDHGEPINNEPPAPHHNYSDQVDDSHVNPLMARNAFEQRHK